MDIKKDCTGCIASDGKQCLAPVCKGCLTTTSPMPAHPDKRIALYNIAATMMNEDFGFTIANTPDKNQNK